MVTNDATLVRLKHRIMEETARLAWDGKLDEENKEKLIYEIIPGPMATYRCCVYKERELVKQRINLSLAKCPELRLITGLPLYRVLLRCPPVSAMPWLL